MQQREDRDILEIEYDVYIHMGGLYPREVYEYISEREMIYLRGDFQFI